MSRLFLALMLALGDVALAFAFDRRACWALVVLPALAATGVRLRLPGFLRSPLVWTSRLLIALVATRGDDFGYSLGLALGVLAGLFLLEQEATAIAPAFIPAVLGVLLAAASRPAPPHFVALGWAVAATVALWLFTAAPRVSLGRWIALGVFAAVSFGLAQALITFLPWAQPHVEQAAVEYLQPSAAEAGLAIGARLGDIEELALSARVVLRLWSDRPANLRVGVYSRFDGRGWKPLPPMRPARLLPRLSGASLAPPPLEDSPGEWHVASDPPPAHPSFGRFILDERPAAILPAPAGVDAVKATEDLIRIDAFGLALAPPVPLLTYALRWGAIAPEPEDPALTQEYLAVPAATDARVRALADQLAQDAPDAAAKIERTAAHLRTHYRYSLKVGRSRTGDPVSEFLFEKKKGYCEYFATATVLLLRLQGVPARYVNGLSVREENRIGDHFLVRASDAHAWAEALLPGVGWIEVDSTPPGDYADVHGRGRSRWEAAWESVRAFVDDVVMQLRQGGWPALRRLLWRGVAAGLRQVAPWLLLAGVLYVAKREWRRRARRPRAARPPDPGVAPDLAEAVRRLDQLWSRAGFPRPPHRALLEHAQALPAHRVHPELHALGLRVTDCFYRGAYGGETVDPDEMARLARALDDAQARMVS